MVGRMIAHYKILEKLGEGGMGIVYKASDTKLNRTVALKFLPDRVNQDATAKGRFLQEAQAAAGLNHPNICTIYGVDEHGGHVFISMEFVEGGTLGDKIPFAKINDAVMIAIQIGEALQEAHAKGIVHRDVKSDNIMLTSRGQAKVMDFGLAKLKGSLKLTRTSSTVGTLGYMAPEQIQGGEADHRSDIFSFGVLLFEMLTGKLPFRGEHEAAMVYSIVNEEPDSLTKYLPDASSELMHILGRALEKDPEDRYQTAHDMVIDLRRLRKESGKVFRSAVQEQPVAVPASGEPSTPPPSTTRQAPTTSVIINIPTLHTRSFLFPGIALGMLIVLGLAYFLFLRNPSTNGERVPVVVADFVNETKEPELDGLSGMLITALEQSRRLDVLPRSRMFDILKLLGKTNTERIDESLGKEICNQAGVNSLILASIRKFGKVYTIDLKVVDAKEGKYLFTATETGEGQESVPSLLDKLSQKTREGFNENRAEIQSASKHVAEITTSNMQAYQHFFQGEQLMNRVKYLEAQEEYKKAVALDTTFGLAYYRLSYATSWEPSGNERAKAPLQKAMAHLDRIPEKERYLVRAQEAQIYRGFGAGIAVLREMEQFYPNEKEMLYNIGDWSFHAGEFVDAEEYLGKVLAMDPTMERALEHLCWTYRDMRQHEKMLEVAKRYAAAASSDEAYTLLARAYLGLERLEEGLKTMLQARDLFPENFQLTGSIADLYSYKEDFSQAESELQSLTQESKPLAVRRFAFERLAYLLPYRGKYQESMKYFDKTIDLYWQLHDTAGAARTIMTKAIMLILQRNDLNGAVRLAERTYGLSGIEDVNYWAQLAELYVFRRDVPAAENIFVKRFSSIKWVDPFYRTLIYSTNNECSKGEAYLDTVLNTAFDHLKIFVLYPTAECQFEAGRFDKAIGLLTQIGKLYSNTAGRRAALYPKSFYLLGKIYEKKGDKKLAVGNFEKFLDLWKDADKDLSELNDAKERLGKLKEVISK
ncbi:MAG: protein kinase [Ignavibacteriales bacterium]|nr:protein kinase [Ignavibacteriales bacterium]